MRINNYINFDYYQRKKQMQDKKKKKKENKNNKSFYEILQKYIAEGKN